MLRALLTVIITATLSLAAHAEQKLQVGKYAIHYVTFGSTFLTPEIAKSYGIERSRYTGLVNISVIDTSQPGSMPTAVAAALSGNARDLTGINKALEFREIREGDAIYYIAELSHRNEETYQFKIDINNQSDLNTTLTFKQKFYVD
ncbi:DUF4426 domain-containing protein [Ferrimonas senticii]|uniref:DUF4426 domain-containing protein n=1 Tax=Ferrimonas senticii TaxID=394566 RepID=UPI00040E35CA|nr:DUF4426 domain-containing protein [Ferrimonas senticii]